jgi:hypothetical protein
MPSDYQGEVELDIDDDSMTPMNKADKRDAMNAFIQNVLLIQKAGITQAEIFKQPSDVPRYNFLEITDDLAELYSVKDFERYVLDSAIQLPLDSGPQPKELVNFNYKDAGPFIQSQIEEMFGFKPDPTHAQALLTNNMAHGTAQAGHLSPPIAPPVDPNAPQGDPNGTTNAGQ